MPAPIFRRAQASDRRSQAMVRIKEAEVLWFLSVRRHRTVRNPNAFMVEIDFAGAFVAGGFLGAGAGEKWPMKEGHLHLSAMIGNRDGKEAGVLVVHMDEIDALVRSKGREPESLPMEQILRNGEGDPWANGRKRRIGHYVALKRFDERDARILAASAAMGRPLVIGFWFERDAQALDAAWIAGLVEFDAGDTYPGKIPLGDEPWKQVEMSVAATHSGRVQDAFDLLRVARLRLHQHPQALQLERDGQAFLQTSDDRFDHPLRLMRIS